MQAIVFIGGQAAGKSTFFKSRFADTHVRINLDMLRTRHREAILLRACVEMKQPFVVDNTNPSRADRQRYIEPARQAGFVVVGYYFESKAEELVRRNQLRPEADRVPDVAVRGTLKQLERPRLEEGFAQLWFVRAAPGGSFTIDEWQHEI